MVPGQQTAEGRTLLFVDEASGAGELLSFTGIVDEPVATPAAYVRTPEGTIHRLIGIGDPYDGTVVTDVGAAADEHSVAVLIGVARGTVPTQYILRARFAGAAEIPAVGPLALVALVALLLGAGLWQLARGRALVR